MSTGVIPSLGVQFSALYRHVIGTKLMARAKVSIYERNGVLWLNFTTQGKRWRVSTGLLANSDGQKAVRAIAGKVEFDIIFQQFSEERLNSYLGRKVDNDSERNNLLDIWIDFFDYQRDRVETTTFKDSLKTANNVLVSLKPTLLKLNNDGSLNLSEIIAELSRTYSASTLSRVFDDFRACGNWAVQTKRLTLNPFESSKRLLPKQQKSNRSRRAFTDYEARAIINAFRSNRFLSMHSRYLHSHYADFVEFLFLTGCRPEDAIALIQSDLNERSSGLYISINKAYSKGVLKTTKTGISRTFRCNESLERILRPKMSFHLRTVNNLLFPSHEEGYICLRDFTRRCWRKVVLQLTALGEVREYLPTYHARHTAITRMLRDGLDPATIGLICGNSPEVIFKNYAQGNEDVTIPEMK
jgi:integrase